MKNILITIVLLLSFSVINFPKPFDQVFDTYRSNISWNEEKLHLDNFAFYLNKNVELIGYIYVFTKETESIKRTKFRVNQATKYLTKNIGSKWRVDKSRIKVIYKKQLNESEIILQPVKKNFHLQNFNC